MMRIQKKGYEYKKKIPLHENSLSDFFEKKNHFQIKVDGREKKLKCHKQNN